MQIEDSQPPLCEKRATNEGGSEDGDDVRLQAVRKRDDIGMVDVRDLDQQVATLEPRRVRAKEEPCLAAARVTAPVAQPPPCLAPKIRGPELPNDPAHGQLTSGFLDDCDRPRACTQPVGNVEMAGRAAAQ